MAKAASASRRRSSPAEERSTRRLRRRGSGGVFAVRDGVWRVDVESRARPRDRQAPARLPHDSRDAGGRRARACPAEGRRPREATAGAIRLSRLTWQDIEYLYGAMRAAGKSPAYVRRCATVLARALDLAHKRGLIDSNPAKDATRPRTSRSKPFAPTTAEVREVLAEAQRRDAEIGDAATILASTGMRRGEFIALRWADVNLDQSEIHVAAAISDGGPGIGLVYKPTKRSDWRDVRLTAAAAVAFKRQAERRTEVLGRAPDTKEYVSPGGIDGHMPMRPDQITNRWAAARGSSPITLLHLRDYTATAMLDAGESYRTVADILGKQ